MLTDATLLFSSAQAITVTAASQNSIDTANNQDLGIGVRHLQLAIYVGTALTGGTSLNVQLQSSQDNATWRTIVETGAIPAAALVANAKIPLDWTHRGIAAETNLFPPLDRYLQLNYVVVGTFTGGTIAFAGVVIDRDENTLPQYKSGYSVGA